MELILNTYGVSLNRDNEGFVITSKDGRQRIPADQQLIHVFLDGGYDRFMTLCVSCTTIPI